MDYKLTETDLNNFYTIEKISKAISKLYDELCELEISGKKKTKIYKEKLELLRWVESEEEKAYYDLKINVDKFRNLIELLNIDISISSIDRVVIGLYEDNYKLRVYNNLFKYLFNSINIVEDMLKETKLEDKYQYTNTKTSIELSMAFNEDFNNLFLKKLQLAIKNRANFLLKKDLIKSKYQLAFMENKLEYLNFNILEDFSILKFLSKIYLVDSSTVNELISSLKYNRLASHIQEMLFTTDEEYKFYDVNVETILKGCFISTYFELVDSNEKLSLLDNLNNLISSIGIVDNKKSIKILSKFINQASK